MCIHVNIARGKQHGDPRKIPALSRKNAHGDAPNESRAHTGSSRVMWADRASSDQAWVSTSYRLHHTVYIIPSTSHRLHLPLCVYITPSTSYRLHHTVYIYPCVSTSHRLHHTVYITPSTSYPWLSRPDPSQCLWRRSERVTSRVKERLGTRLDV